MDRSLPVDLKLDELRYSPFTISMNRCHGSCNTVEDLFGRAFVSNKMEEVNLKVFNMTKGTNESKTLTKLIS